MAGVVVLKAGALRRPAVNRRRGEKGVTFLRET
jgi:hypothetical protein